MRYFFMMILFFSSLVARDNPFQPVSEFKEDKLQPTHIIKQQEEFEKQEFSLPNTSRVLKYIKVGYQALDGSLQEEQIDIDKAMDWRDRFIITKKSSITPPPSPRKLEKTLRKEPMTKKKEIQKPAMPKKEIAKKVVKQEPIEQPAPKEKTFAFGDLLEFTVTDKILIIRSNDPLLRDLYVPNPYKLVLDFTRANSFYTKSVDIDLSPFKKVVFGSHNGYYRASFALDGPYKYTIYKKEGLIEIHLR